MSSSEISELCDMKKLLEDLSKNVILLLPIFQNIENRLEKIERELHISDISELTASIKSIKSELELSKEFRVVCPSTDSSATSDQSSQSDQSEGVVHEAHHNPGHTGLLLSDSDLTLSQVKQVGDHLTCNVTVVNYNSDSEVVKQVLVGTGYDFVLIQDSGDTVTKQEIVTHDTVEEIQNLARYQLELARMVGRLKPDTEVFIGCLPPRFDTEAHTQLAEVYNNTLVVESFLDDHIRVVSQNMMYSNNNRQLEERFADDRVTLTKYGNFLLSKNISREIIKMVPYLTKKKKSKNYRKNRVKRRSQALFAY